MKSVIQVKLRARAEHFQVLKLTLELCNRAADRASSIAHQSGAAVRNISKESVQRAAYHEMKAMGLSAQPAIHVCRKVAGAYATLRTNLRSGNYGKPGSKRRTSVETRPVTFRSESAQPFDDRCLSWQFGEGGGTVSIWTTAGRLKNIPFVGQAEQLRVLRDHRQGESDLVIRDGNAYLIATVDVPEQPMNMAPTGWLGVDMGIVNLATTSDGDHSIGDKVIGLRHRHRRLRGRLQKKGTKSAKRLLKKRSRKETRFAADVNHCISKKIVIEAQRTGRGIALEDLTGIRDRVRLRKPQRVTLHSWAFSQLGVFLAYKSLRAGVPLVYVDPAYTSQTCHACGNVDKKSRINQATYQCCACGVVAHADVNAALNIADRGAIGWADVNQPHAA
jgi:IS605 OrfB family transposase